MVEINPFSALSTVGQASSDRKTIAQNFEAFLSLLTTQLKNQSPLDPLDTNQFTQQLVQFTEVEQAVKMNRNLETLTKLAAATTITNAVGYIGKEVTASGSAATLSAGNAAWRFSVADTSPNTTFTVFDANGSQIYSETRPVGKGAATFTWDGRTPSGTVAPDGSYRLAIRALDSKGNQLQVSTSVAGIVDGVDMSGAEPVLLVGGREVKLHEVTVIKIPNNS